ncbi:MAG: type II secretion system protein GspM [Gallionella sp.]|nr:type II secretion system protein GspM [Gallionella sp.]
MKLRLKKLRQQNWDTRTLTERKIIIAGALLVLPLAAYLLLWRPAHQAVSQLHKSLPQLRIQTGQMRIAAGQIEEIRHRPQLAVMDAEAVKAAIEVSAAKYQLQDTLTTLIAQEPAGVRLSISAISFEKWLIWLRELENSQHIRVDSIAITRLAQPGLVAVRATLTNGSTL